MLPGRISLRSQFLARVVFSPIELADGFRQTWLKGTVFDRGLRPGEADVVSNYRGSTSGLARGATQCPQCGTIVLPP
jgi:hypothetical protein